jgi:putative addiction module killer protein
MTIQYRELPEFVAWMDGLRDTAAKQRIAMRLLRAKHGHLGDVKPVGQGVSELRIDFGPGYRIYVKKRGLELLIILCAGDKSSQSNDILRALQLSQQCEE